MKSLETIKKDHKTICFPFQIMKVLIKGGTEKSYMCSQRFYEVLSLCIHLSELHTKPSAGISYLQ